MINSKTVLDLLQRSINEKAVGQDHQDFQPQFTIRFTPAESRLYMLLGAAASLVALFLFLVPREFEVGLLFGILGGALLIFGLFFLLFRYKVDEEKIQEVLGFIVFRTHNWSEIQKVILHRDGATRTKTIACYGSKRILFDCNSSMIGFSRFKKMLSRKKSFSHRCQKIADPPLLSL